MSGTNAGRKMHTQDCLHKSAVSARAEQRTRREREGERERGGGGIIGLRCV